MVGESGVAAKHTRRRTLAPSWRLFARTNRHFSSAFSSPRIARVPPRSPHTDGRDAAPRVRRVGPRVRARALPSRTSRFRARTPPPRALEPATPPERSPSDEPAAPHRVFSRFAVWRTPDPHGRDPEQVRRGERRGERGAGEGFPVHPEEPGDLRRVRHRRARHHLQGMRERIRTCPREEIGFPSFFLPPPFPRGDDERFERFSSRAAYDRKRTDHVPSRCPGTEQRYTDKKYGRPEKKFM